MLFALSVITAAKLRLFFTNGSISTVNKFHGYVAIILLPCQRFRIKPEKIHP